MRILKLFTCAAFTALLVACGMFRSPVDPGFESVPAVASWRVEWQPSALLGNSYPVLPPLCRDEQLAAGRTFLADVARIDDAVLKSLEEIVLVQTDGQGLFGAERHRLVKGEGYTLTYEVTRPRFEQKISIGVDAHFRMLSYQADFIRHFADGPDTNIVRCVWDEL